MTTFDIRFTHFGMHVRNLESMATFYKDVLGLVETDRGTLNGRDVVFLSRDPDEHHQVILFSGLAEPPREEIINQISFRVPDLETLIAFHAELSANTVAEDIRPINHGNAWSVYFRDPEQNRIEVYVPSPWYILQPCREPLAIEDGAGAIRTLTEAWCRAQPSFRLAEDVRADLAARIAGATSNSRPAG